MRKEARTEVLNFFSPAKLNLFFRVLKKREDGFHEIASLMQAISLGDTLRFAISDEDCLTSSDPHLPCDSSNLASKALSLFRSKTRQHFPVKIHIEKRIPIEAGLGGGSSNLATTLWALNCLSEKPVSIEELKKWAGELSSDAPFFFSSGTAYSTGRGEKIESLSPLPSRSFWLAKPSIGMSTPLVYRHCKPSSGIDPLHLLRLDTYINDLEKPAFSLEPSLEKLKNDLLALGFETATMTGSGSAFFCFGNLTKTPALPGIQFISAAFLSRPGKDWYRDK